MSSMKIWALGAALAAALPQLATAQTLRWSSQGDIATMDPYAHTEKLHVQHPPPCLRSAGAPQPQARDRAGPGDSLENRRPDRWPLRARPGVKFHNGDAFNADDVVASDARLLDPTARARGNLANVILGPRRSTT